MPSFTRRRFLSGLSCLAGLGLTHPLRTSQLFAASLPPNEIFPLSLAQWSLHRSLHSGKLSNLGFPAEAARLGFRGVEYVNQFFMHRAKDQGYLGELKRRCEQVGVKSLLIMCDAEGALGDPDDARRTSAIENHRKWIGAAAFLGCHSIRVNAQSEGTREEQQHLAADGLRRLTEIGADAGIQVIVENHGGWSSDGVWLANVMHEVDHPMCGTLPDFGNFSVGDVLYDRYQGVKLMMPFAKAVSAKSHDFAEDGSEKHTDYLRMLKIVHAAGYRSWIGVEYEGSSMSEVEGILATKRLLEEVRMQIQDECS
ncbi:MAG: sugar phosphate isomerase/epimerase family protein [Planctomycetota bacterium]